MNYCHLLCKIFQTYLRNFRFVKKYLTALSFQIFGYKIKKGGFSAAVCTDKGSCEDGSACDDDTVLDGSNTELEADVDFFVVAAAFVVV